MKRAALLAAALTLTSTAAQAAGSLGPNDSAIQTSDYGVDLSQGVVLAGTRVLGLAGAYVAIAEGVDGNSQNPAAPAVRLPYSFDHFDYDLGFGLTFPASVAGNDFFNTGQRTQLRSDPNGFVFLNAAANLQFGNWGVGVSVDFQRYRLDRVDDQQTGVQLDQLIAQFGGARLQLARAFADNQFVVGVGSRGTGLIVRNENPSPGQPTELFDASGAALEAGMLWKPNELPVRVGAAVRSEVITTEPQTAVDKDANGDRVIGAGVGDQNSLWLPNDVTLPWDINVGFAVQIGPRPLNPRWLDPDQALDGLQRYDHWRAAERERKLAALVHKARAEGKNPDAAEAAARARFASETALEELHYERAARAVREKLRQRYRSMRRFYVLFSTSLLVTGPAKNSVGVESFLQRRVDRSGEHITLSPRLGMETEVVPAWLKLRAGTYGEPTRFAQGAPRLHGTLGFDQKLFPWTVFGLFDDGTEWRISGALDGAQRYFGWGASLGVWH